MKTLVLIIVMAIAAIGLTLGTLLIFAQNKIKSLKKGKTSLREENANLREEVSKQSDQLRLKGIEIDELKKELDKYSEVEIKVALTSQEKKMILNALDSPQYKAKIEDPKTKFFTRKIYSELKERIKESIKTW